MNRSSSISTDYSVAHITHKLKPLDISWSNMIRYCKQYERKKDKTLFRLWIYKRHPPYLALTDELWGFFSGLFEEKISQVHCIRHPQQKDVFNAGLIPGLHPANERQRYFVTRSLIGWAQTCNQPCNAKDMHALTHWGRVTHICICKLSMLGSDNGLWPGRRQAII